MFSSINNLNWSSKIPTRWPSNSGYDEKTNIRVKEQNYILTNVEIQRWSLNYYFLVGIDYDRMSMKHCFWKTLNVSLITSRPTARGL